MKCANLTRQTEQSLTKKKRGSEQTRLSEKQQRIWHKRQHEKNSAPHWMTFSLHKTPSLTSGWVLLVLWPPGSRNWMVAVCVLMGREVNSSKTPFKFRHSYTKAFRGLFTGRCDVRWSATIQETFPPTVSLRADSNKAEKKDQHVNTKFASLYIKAPWNGITVNGVSEGGGVWCVISPRSPPTPPIFPQLTPLNLLP